MTEAGIEKPDTEGMLAGLKPFQRDTVEYVFRRLYTDPDCTRRFLVADEVGLGKTMVARGVIARAIDHLEQQVDRVDIVYICSNADIARQNLQRLNLTGNRDAARAGRLTMLPAMLPQLDPRLNFVAFTPGTSFNMGSSSGKKEERALLFWMLEDLGRLPRDSQGRALHQGAAQLFQAGIHSLSGWQRFLRSRWLPGVGDLEIDATLLQRFDEALTAEAQRAAARGEKDLQTRIEDTSAQLKRRYIRSVSDELWSETRAITSELRALLARSCLDALEPDLVVLDEFQRFKELLDPNNEAGDLAHQLFNYSDPSTAVRTLLLSATPYKMYTLHSEQHEDDHYRDFMDTLRFLFDDDERTAGVAQLLKDMRRALYRIPSAGPGQAVKCRTALEAHLRKVMVRTERARGSDSGDDMVEELADHRPTLSAADAGRYLGLQRMVGAINGPDMIEYWKSSPYLLNFMDEYQVKRDLREAIQVGGNPALTDALRRHESLLLSGAEITEYQAIDPGNGRLRTLLDEILDEDSWRMLWIPPSLPPYRLGGPFTDSSERSPTKRLIFSAWHVVPKTIAAMVSYEVERRLHTRFDSAAENTPEAREGQSQLLRFGLREGQANAMSLFTLLFPSSALARIGGEALAAAAREAGGEPPELDAVLRHAESAIRAILPAAPETPPGTLPDESWYWAAPIILDLADEPEQTRSWWTRSRLAYAWTPEEKEAGAAGLNTHIERARGIVQGERPTGKQPEDLVAVLAEIAIAAPATSALRSLRSVSGYGGTDTPTWLRDSAARIGWAYRSLFNQVEAIILIRGEALHGEGAPYWREVLRYALEGGLPAVNDEHLHMLGEITAAGNQQPASACARLVEAFEEGTALPPRRVEWDEFRSDDGQPTIHRTRLRTHFAARFGQIASDEGGVTGKEQVRAAFNSPFWPFVLASTSVGQEGLDFHPYCHAIVHWNLPSNPVDMEQREGRIHRYKGHAVRKNVAHHFREEGRAAHDGDRWRLMFDRAREQDGGAGRGLVPDWNYPLPGGARIQRLVPVLPFSRDSRKHERLRKSLAAYRMVFGQARQEDLVAYLLEHVGPEYVGTLSEQLRIDLSPPGETASR